MAFKTYAGHQTASRFQSVICPTTVDTALKLLHPNNQSNITYKILCLPDRLVFYFWLLLAQKCIPIPQSTV